MNNRAHNLDFVLSDGGFCFPRLIFRFYPDRSHMHGFGDEPPKTFKGVYKVYYSWCVLQRGLDENGNFDDNSEPVFHMYWDECSALTDLSALIDFLVSDETCDYDKHEALSFGQPGSIWEIQRRKRGCHLDGVWTEHPKGDVIDFVVWNNYTNLGYRFSLDLEKASAFSDYLKKVNLYMLAHSEPI